MDAQKMEIFLATNGSKFAPHHVMMIRERLEKLDDSKYPVLQSVNFQDPTTLVIISILIGGLGVDRFMLNQVGLGVAKLLTCGGFGIWWLVDIFMIQGATRDENFKKFMQYAA